MDDNMFQLLKRNADENATARQAKDKTAVRKAVEKVWATAVPIVCVIVHAAV
jgi:hypothetical protein